VSWFDATAFCRWLSARLGYEVRLPDEAEWQLAATGNRRRYGYPWGEDWRRECANTSASRLSRTCAVGMYPGGAAACGALDMSGNVCEWTASLGPLENQRVLRGGAWYLSPAEARATARTFSFAYERLSHFGFRVACAAPAAGASTKEAAL
jgi:formylglycine-generating enzyme required for sulfatase activity